MTDKTFDPRLWTDRSPEETRELYTNWAATYDTDVSDAGYATPTRLSEALAAHVPDLTAPVLDFGCGTGLSGQALHAAGFTTLHGTDITPDMLAKASDLGLYQKLWASDPGARPPSGYATIAAIGVVSLGAAPASTLATLLDALAPGGHFGFSYNDATLADPAYMAALDTAQASADLIHDAYGPHLPAKDMGSRVYVLRKH
jgi:predicted TPR repeat methyltransferase